MKIPSIEALKNEDFSILLSADYRTSMNRRRRFYLFLKRLQDIVFSAFGMVVLAPLFLLIIILIRLTSLGPAIFMQNRVGREGGIFRVYKFRSMHKDAKHEDYAPREATDPRITAVGRFLRRTSLDELPQLWNVLKGEMSLVGPRPEMKFIVDTYNPLQRARLLVKPGLTGLWQIYGRKDLPLHENVEYDLYYILHRSLWLDILTVFRTANVVVGGRKIYKKNF